MECVQLLDNPSAERPERRTALLARYKIDIAALSETRLANEGQLTESAGVATQSVSIKLSMLFTVLDPQEPHLS